MKGVMSECYKKEEGAGVLGMFVGLGLSSLVLMMLVIVIRELNVHSAELKGNVQVLESLAAAEDFLRKEFQSLQFVPYCTGVLPPYHRVRLGSGMADEYRDYLQESFRVLMPRDGSKAEIVDLRALRGSGGATYMPPPRKNLTGILLGSEVLQVVGLLPTALSFQEGIISGYLTSELVGVRRLVFYVTDCQEGMVLEGSRVRDAFVVSEQDSEVLKRSFNQSRLHVYVVREYLIYLRVENQEPYLVIDFLDGQAFLRIPHIVDLSIVAKGEGVLSIGLLAALKSYGGRYYQSYEGERSFRQLKNAGVVHYRDIWIGLER